MTSRERFLAGLCGKPADRPPVAHIAAATTVGLQADTGCFMPDVHHNPERLVRLMAANHDVLGFDAVTFLINFFNPKFQGQGHSNLLTYGMIGRFNL